MNALIDEVAEEIYRQGDQVYRDAARLKLATALIKAAEQHGHGLDVETDVYLALKQLNG